MTVLITGGGLIGSQVARLLVEVGERPVILDVSPKLDALSDIVDLGRVKVVQGDVLNPHDLYRIVRQEGIDRIIHTAANPGLTEGAQSNPYAAVQVNVIGTLNVLEVARALDVDRVVFTSTAALYHYVKHGPYGPRPSTVYVTTKLACENLGFNYADLYGIEFITLRLAAVFGPWRYVGGGVWTRVFRDVVEAIARGNGTVKVPPIPMEFTYSKDAARACVLACKAARGSLKRGVYNISMGRVYGLEDLRSIIAKMAPNVEVVTMGQGEFTQRAGQREPIDLTASREELGFEPMYDMEAALMDYVEWFRNVLMKARV